MNVTNSGSAADVSVIAILLGEDGTFLYAATQDAQLAQGSAEVVFEGAANAQARSIKVLVWESLGSMKPKAEAFEADYNGK